MAPALPWTFSLLLLAIPSEAVKQKHHQIRRHPFHFDFLKKVISSCFTCSGDTKNATSVSVLCMGGEDEAPKYCLNIINIIIIINILINNMLIIIIIIIIIMLRTITRKTCEAPNNQGCLVKAYEELGKKEVDRPTN